MPLSIVFDEASVTRIALPRNRKKPPKVKPPQLILFELSGVNGNKLSTSGEKLTTCSVSCGGEKYASISTEFVTTGLGVGGFPHSHPMSDHMIIRVETHGPALLQVLYAGAEQAWFQPTPDTHTTSRYSIFCRTAVYIKFSPAESDFLRIELNMHPVAQTRYRAEWTQYNQHRKFQEDIRSETKLQNELIEAKIRAENIEIRLQGMASEEDEASALKESLEKENEIITVLQGNIKEIQEAVLVSKVKKSANAKSINSKKRTFEEGKSKEFIQVLMLTYRKMTKHNNLSFNSCLAVMQCLAYLPTILKLCREYNHAAGIIIVKNIENVYNTDDESSDLCIVQSLTSFVAHMNLNYKDGLCNIDYMLAESSKNDSKNNMLNLIAKYGTQSSTPLQFFLALKDAVGKSVSELSKITDKGEQCAVLSKMYENLSGSVVSLIPERETENLKFEDLIKENIKSELLVIEATPNGLYNNPAAPRTLKMPSIDSSYILRSHIDIIRDETTRKTIGSHNAFVYANLQKIDENDTSILIKANHASNIQNARTYGRFPVLYFYTKIDRDARI